MTDRYILVNGKVKPEPDLLKWTAWFEAADRQVARTTCGEYVVSTVFLGEDHSFGEGPPLIFETMVFPLGEWNQQDMNRYSTLEQAKAGHADMVKNWTGGKS
ncbi:MAG TPA: hypothetical protein ENH62_16225 [Marinobacter sp.]|uniref:Uncharacterized protein n=1 Tax=marine sediment metagenome TaxID=412755 RepID=A0A0F9IXK0_9ZZZZ|nr:hypothetical protein [Marinobacter sp.]